MAFDYKKEYKEFYMPKNKPSIVIVPRMNYIAVRRRHDQLRRCADLRFRCFKRVFAFVSVGLPDS